MRKIDKLKRQLSILNLARAHITQIMSSPQLTLLFAAILGKPEVYDTLLWLDNELKYLELEESRLQREIKRIERRFKRNAAKAEEKREG